MKAVKLNLEDRQSWQKFQHVLTSFASDYIDLIAPEQTEFKFEQQILSLTFTLIATSPDRERANNFTQNLESFLSRLGLIGVRRVELEFFAADAEAPIFNHGFEVPFAAPTTVIVPSTTSSRLSRRVTSVDKGGRGGARGRAGLARRLRGWLASPQLLQNLQTSRRLAVRDPKGFLSATGSATATKFNETVTWFDTFAWEDWFKSRLQEQQRRHKRNLLRALIEDFAIAAVLILSLYWAGDFLSGPTINLATLPAQHYDGAADGPKYRCGNPGITKKNYVCLNRGMSYKQVTSVLGGEGKPLALDPKYGDRAVVISWKTLTGATLNATFKEDYLVAKAQRDLPI